MADEVEPGKAKAAGIVSIMIAIIALALLICGFMFFGYASLDGSGLWSGFGMMVIAILGIVTWLKRNKATMVFFLVLSILWFIIDVVQVIVAFLGWAIFAIFNEVVQDHCRTESDTCVCTDKDVPIDVSDCNDLKVIATLYLCVMILSALAAILSLAASIIGCMGTCCASRNETTVVVVGQPGTAMQAYPPLDKR